MVYYSPLMEPYFPFFMISSVLCSSVNFWRCNHLFQSLWTLVRKKSQLCIRAHRSMLWSQVHWCMAPSARLCSSTILGCVCVWYLFSTGHWYPHHWQLCSLWLVLRVYAVAATAVGVFSGLSIWVEKVVNVGGKASGMHTCNFEGQLQVPV